MNEGNFIDSLKGLEGIQIRLFLSDEQFVEGTLLSIHEDHLTVKVEEKIVYFPINQIKALSKNARDSKHLKNLDQENITVNAEPLEERLKSMRMQWVTINSFDNQIFTGILNKISDDHVMLTENDNQIFILKSHIKNIFKGFIKVSQNEEQIDSNENNSENTENSNTENNENTEQSSEQLNDTPSLNSENPPTNDAENSTSFNSPTEEDKRARKKNHEFLQLKEVKFNSPIQECTWNTKAVSDSQDASIDCQNEQKVEELPEQDVIENLDTEISDEQEVEQVEEEQEEQPVMIMEDNIALMEKQYFALMKFAKKMNELENQYQTLMKHAEKMYLQIRKQRKY